MKTKVSLKKNIYIMLAIVLFVAVYTFSSEKVYALGTGEWLGIPDADQSLNPQEQLVEIGILGTYKKEGESAAFQSLKRQTEAYKAAGKSLDQQMVQDLINQGYFPNYIEEIKALGYTDVDYSAVSGGSSTPVQTETTELAPVSEPAAFTVEDMEDTPMWATQAVNYRNGASTEYDKVGSLEQYEQIIVNGVASTGWYRFDTSDGTAVYVSDKYLTVEDPGNRELNIYNEETEQVDTYVFENEDPEAIDKAIDAIKDEHAQKEPEIKDPEPEPVQEETIEPEPVAEPVSEPVAENDSRPWQFYVIVACAALCAAVIGISIYYLVRNKKRGRAD